MSDAQMENFCDACDGPCSDSHDIPKPTEQYDIDIATRGKSDLPNPHEVNSDGSYCDSTMTWREACGCSEANVLDNNHNVCIGVSNDH